MDQVSAGKDAITNAAQATAMWLHSPFIGGGSPLTYFILVGIAVVSLFIWSRALIAVEGEI